MNVLFIFASNFLFFRGTPRAIDVLHTDLIRPLQAVIRFDTRYRIVAYHTQSSLCSPDSFRQLNMRAKDPCMWPIRVPSISYEAVGSELRTTLSIHSPSATLAAGSENNDWSGGRPGPTKRLRRLSGAHSKHSRWPCLAISDGI